MALEVDDAAPRTQPTRPERRPRQNFETWSWFFMRISGLVLLFLALTHFTLTHITTDVADTDAVFVTERWDNPLWRIFDWTLLALALMHGLNGLRWIIDDYIPSPGKRVAVKAVLYTVTGALFAYGTLTIVTFTPEV
jgi:succinate dehydrogenase / fumarate reductase membrane anchor subunit